MKAKLVVISIFGVLIALGVFLYRDYWNSKPMWIRRANDKLFAQKIGHFRSASPQRDAVAAVARGNLHFYIVRREGSTRIPGITNGSSMQWIYERKQHQVIYDVSDVLTSGLEQEYHQAAWNYAAAYNLALEQLVQTNITLSPSAP